MTFGSARRSDPEATGDETPNPQGHRPPDPATKVPPPGLSALALAAGGVSSKQRPPKFSDRLLPRRAAQLRLAAQQRERAKDKGRQTEGETQRGRLRDHRGRVSVNDIA